MIAATGWRNNRWANRYPAGVTCKRERSQVRARNASGGGRAARQPDRIHVGWCAIGAGCDLLHHTVCHRRLRAESNGRRSAGGGLHPSRRRSQRHPLRHPSRRRSQRHPLKHPGLRRSQRHPLRHPSLRRSQRQPLRHPSLRRSQSHPFRHPSRQRRCVTIFLSKHHHSHLFSTPSHLFFSHCFSSPLSISSFFSSLQ